MTEENSEGIEFKVDCSNLKALIDLEDIKNLNKMVVAPEKYREELGLDQDEVTVFSEMLEASRQTGQYEIGHENDDYHLGKSRSYNQPPGDRVQPEMQRKQQSNTLSSCPDAQNN